MLGLAKILADHLPPVPELFDYLAEGRPVIETYPLRWTRWLPSSERQVVRRDSVLSKHPQGFFLDSYVSLEVDPIVGITGMTSTLVHTLGCRA